MTAREIELGKPPSEVNGWYCRFEKPPDASEDSSNNAEENGLNLNTELSQPLARKWFVDAHLSIYTIDKPCKTDVKNQRLKSSCQSQKHRTAIPALSIRRI